jgi:hypothetical protein
MEYAFLELETPEAAGILLYFLFVAVVLLVALNIGNNENRK